MREKLAGKLAGCRFARNHALPNTADREILVGERVRLLRIPGDRMRIPRQGKPPSGLKIALSLRVVLKIERNHFDPSRVDLYRFVLKIVVFLFFFIRVVTIDPNRRSRGNKRFCASVQTRNRFRSITRGRSESAMVSVRFYF